MSRLGRTQVLATSEYSQHQPALKRPRYNNSSTLADGQDLSMADAATSPGNAAQAQQQQQQSKRPNFSLAVANPNGVNKITTSLATGKPGTAKKLIIKNFKGKDSFLLFQILER